MANFTADQTVYTTRLGTQVAGDSLELLKQLDDECVDLIVTSPPFALLRKKSYGNESQEEYVDWLAQFGVAAKRVLKRTGSLVVDLGNAYRKGSPTRALYPYRVLLKFVDELGYYLAEEFFWHNTAKLPSPLEWVNKRRIRVKDSVNTVWWFSKTEWPHADVNEVLVPYSARMKQLLADPKAFYDAKDRPSEHSISEHFGNNNGGAIPPNLLQLANTDSNSNYLRACRELDVKSHPARFPEGIPEFFIKFLTTPGDLVIDIFSGSNTTGMVAEALGRRWYAFELDRDYAALSIIRFLDDQHLDTIQKMYELALTSTVTLREPTGTVAATQKRSTPRAVGAATKAAAALNETEAPGPSEREIARVRTQAGEAARTTGETSQEAASAAAAVQVAADVAVAEG